MKKTIIALIVLSITIGLVLLFKSKKLKEEEFPLGI